MTMATTEVNADAATTQSYSKVYETAKKQLGKRYSWGSVGPHSFDCSGLTKYVYKKSIKKSLPRTAQAQYNGTKKVSKHNRKKGDLVYFGTSKHNISHVGVYIGGGKMIDAQNRGVIIEKVSAPWWHAVGYSRPVANLK
ncbi:C40 family peptidase [Lentilactobacillus kribbianus]|uniref:C40 family peptidase n=1 Tax=Lentilactobacillus kribbianus TaxID=2729622 RepID=UPI0015529ADC|nr:NlpC/P60 family protein [Lentilactobacillus kribbianus]